MDVKDGNNLMESFSDTRGWNTIENRQFYLTKLICWLTFSENREVNDVIPQGFPEEMSHQIAIVLRS